MDINRYKQQGMIVERGRRDFNRNICRKKYLYEMSINLESIKNKSFNNYSTDSFREVQCKD